MTAAMTATVVLAAVAAALAVSFSLQARDATNQALNSLLPAESTADRLLANMIDQETGERGYVITAQDRFLQPYVEGRQAFGPLAGTLRDELGSDPAAQSRLRKVLDRYDSWLHDFAEPQINAVAGGSQASAIQQEKSGVGKAEFDQLRHSFAALQSHVESRQRGITAEAGSLQSDVFWLLVSLLGCLAIGAFAGSVFLYRWVIGPIHHLEQEVTEASGHESDREVRPSGPSEILSLGASVESMRHRLLQQGIELGQQREIVAALQNALLPRQLPRLDGFEFAARYVPAAQAAAIGGDWYNVRNAGPMRAFVAVGDVAGSGIEAAALMASVRYAINAYAAEDPDPSIVLTRLSALFDLTGDDRFATVICCLIDGADQIARFASAGHPSPLMFSTDAAEPIRTIPGPPIGLGKHRYSSVTVPMAESATILMFSDGLVERRDESIDVSIGNLARSIESDQPLAAMLDDVLAHRTQPFRDDTIACAIRMQRDTMSSTGDDSDQLLVAREHGLGEAWSGDAEATATDTGAGVLLDPSS